MKTGDAIAEILKREGVEWIIGYPVNHILEHGAAADIRPIIVRQERIGLHMADAIARVTSGKKIGVFVMQHGPGAENAYGGVAQAYSESVPILVMPHGLCPRAWPGSTATTTRHVNMQRHHQVGRAGDVGQGAAERHAARLPAPALRPRRPGAGRGAERLCGPRSADPLGLRAARRRYAPAPIPTPCARRPRCWSRPSGRDLRRPGRALGARPGASCKELAELLAHPGHAPASRARAPSPRRTRCRWAPAASPSRRPVRTSSTSPT